MVVAVAADVAAVAAEAAVAAVAAAAGAAAVSEAAAYRGASAVFVESMQFLAHRPKKEGAVGRVRQTTRPIVCATVPLRLARTTDPRPERCAAQVLDHL